jgi:hypothetical protein
VADRLVARASDAADGPSPEDVVFDRLRSALPGAVRLHRNVRWVAAPGDGPNADGETDLLLVDPDRGLLVIEVKGGTIRVDGAGRWYAGHRLLEMSPAAQAERGKRRLVALFTGDADWIGGPPRAGHAVAFPGVDWASLGPGARSLSLDTPRDLVLDAEDLETDASARAAVERLWSFWLGSGGRGEPIPARDVDLMDRSIARPAELRPLLRREVDEGEREVRQLTAQQMWLLDALGERNRRVAISGGAGTGKTEVAAEKARRLARDGYRTLLLCFNQPLARRFRDDDRLAELIATGRLDALTFHELALRLDSAAGLRPPGPPPADAAALQAWFEATVDALDDAIAVVPDRWHAIVVDEGQDFAIGWLESIAFLLEDRADDVYFVFHDPGQGLYREDEVDALGFTPMTLPMNCRNPQAIHALAERFAHGATPSDAIRSDGPAPEIVEADGAAATVEAVRLALHRTLVEGKVPPWRVVVLVGTALWKSPVWRARTFGNAVLWNGSVDDDGHSLGLSLDAVPDQPSDTVLCETIHRFKGLDREVVILADLRADDPRLDRLLYIGITRAREHLVVVAPPDVCARLR